LAIVVVQYVLLDPASWLAALSDSYFIGPSDLQFAPFVSTLMQEELCLGMYLTNAVDFYKLRLDEQLRSSLIGSGNLLDQRSEAALIDAILLATPAFLSPKDEATIPLIL
jgi:hypothetical protein